MRRGLRPIETMAGQADKITAGDLTERVRPQDPRTEVGRLGAALNGMLARIEDFITEREASQEATRRFFADASHELRTPLASLRANAELYQQGALTERARSTRRCAASRWRPADERAGRRHAPAGPPGPASRAAEEPVDLSSVLQGCVERARIADPQRAWHADIDPGLVMTGDEELLRRAVDNLLANVSTHTPPGTAATTWPKNPTAPSRCRSATTGPASRPGSCPDLRPLLPRRRAVGAAGSGLGLAIVTAVAATHAGTAHAGAQPATRPADHPHPARHVTPPRRPGQLSTRDGLHAGRSMYQKARTMRPIGTSRVVVGAWRGGMAKSEHLVKCGAQRAPCRWAASPFLPDLPLEPA